MSGQCWNWGIKESDEWYGHWLHKKAEILNRQFKSVFTAEDRSTIPDKGTSPYPSIPDIDVTLDGMRNLFKIWPAVSDNIHAAVLKHTAFETAPLLTHLFQQSLRNGILPVSYKQANITPIHKKVIKQIQEIIPRCLLYHWFVKL